MLETMARWCSTTRHLLLTVCVISCRTAVRAACRQPTVDTTASGCDAGFIRPASISLLVLADQVNQDGLKWQVSIQSGLRDTGLFAKVDRWHINQSLPTLEILLGYQAVYFATEAIHWGLANLTVDYWEAGGSFVLSAISACYSPPSIEAWRSPPYDPSWIMLGGLWDPSVRISELMLVDTRNGCPWLWDGARFSFEKSVVEKTSPLMAGITSMSQLGGTLWNASEIINGGVVVARWDNGWPLVVRGLKNGRTLAALGLYAVSSIVRWELPAPPSTVSRVQANALLYSTCAISCGNGCGAGTLFNATLHNADPLATLPACSPCGAGAYQTGVCSATQRRRLGRGASGVA